jgi:hypothetical protein
MTEIQTTVSGVRINWESGATALLKSNGKDIEIVFHYEPLGVEKNYTLVETENKKYQCGRLVATKGMMMR